MFLSDISVKRPVFATMLNVVLIVFGLFAIPNIGIDQDPNVDFPLAVVTALYPGADPNTVEQKLLNLIERNLNGLEGLETIEGSATPNLATLILRFSLERKTSEILDDIRDRLSIIQGDPDYPKEANTPTVAKYDIAGTPVGILVLSAKNYPLGDLSVFAKETLSPILQQANGVGQVTLVGARPREIKILLNPSALESFNLSPVFVAQIIRAQISEIPGGNIENDEEVIQIQANGVPMTLDDIRKISIPVGMGQGIALENVARIVDTLAFEESYGEFNGQSSIIIIVDKQPGENVVWTVDNLKKKIQEVDRLLPPSSELKFVHDGSVYIKESIKTVFDDLILGAILAILIVFVFLRDWRSTLISGLALPIAVMGTIAIINALGFTLNSMSTLALTLSIGLLVDDAIVVIENIHRHRQMGKNAMQAAKDGTAEIGLATLAITSSIAAVFIPVAFMKGIVGRFFFQFGITVTVAILLSLFIAFTLTPMMSSKMLGESHEKNAKHGFFYNTVEAFLKIIEKIYVTFLRIALKNRFIVLLIGIGAFVLSIYLLQYVPKSFVPNEDKNEIDIIYQLPSSYPLSLTKKKAREMTDFIRAHYSGVKDIVLTVGEDIQHLPYRANLSVYLVDRESRSYSFADLQEKMRKDFAKHFSGDDVEITVSSPAIGGGRSQNIQLKLLGPDNAKLIQWSNHIINFMKEKLPDAEDITSNYPPEKDQVNLITNFTKAMDLNITTSDIGNIVNLFFTERGTKVGDFQRNTTQRDDVRIQIDPSFAQEIDDVTGIYIKNSVGEPIALTGIADVKIGKSPTQINHIDSIRSITILSNYTGQDLKFAIDALEEELQKTLPTGFVYEFDGQSKYMGEALTALTMAILMAFILVFMILCAQFESYSSPFVIMLTVPLAFSGAFAALLITKQPMSLFTMIGLVLLIGLVVKNGILLVDFTLQRMKDGFNVTDSLLHAAPIRLKPILMTTFAMIFGMIPIALGHGAGGESRAPMAVCVIGGLVSSTLLTLVIIPCVFSLMQESAAKISRFFHKTP